MKPVPWERHSRRSWAEVPTQTVTSTAVLPPQVSPPAFALSALPPHELGVEVLALPFTVDDGTPVLGVGAAEAAEALGLDLSGILVARRAKGTGGEVVPVPVAGPGDLRLVLLAGLGAEETTDYRRAGAAVARAAFDHESVASAVPAGAAPEALTAYVVGTMLGSFVFHWRSQGPEHEPVRRVVLAGLSGNDHASSLERGLALGGAGWRSRMLATVPSNLKSPQWLAEQAEHLAEEAGLSCEIWDDARLAKQGFGGIIGVGQGSATPPRLIRLDYTPSRGRRAPRVVLVGKGITFDSGGLSIKPAEGMSTMKRDMTGGAVVMAVMAALGAPRLPAARDRARAHRGERRRRLVAAARRRGDPLRRPHQRGDEHRRRGAAGARGRHGLRPRQARPCRPGRRRHADRDDEGRPRPVDRRLLREPRRPGGEPGERGCRGGGAAVADAPRARLRGHPDLERRRRHQLPERPRRDHGGAVPAALRRRRPVGPPRHRLHGRLPGRLLRVDEGSLRLRSPGPAHLADGAGSLAGSSPADCQA